jgi:hypothetical protein
MLQISKEQFLLFKADALNRANLRMVQYAKERFPDLTMDKLDKDIMSFVIKVRRLANQNDLTEETDVATALDLSVMYGIDFYSELWVSDVFMIPEWSGAYKIEIIRDRVRRLILDF